jgi:hypothetical protein
MKKLLLLLLLSLGFIGSTSADDLSEELHVVDYSHLSDTTICSWFQTTTIPHEIIAEAKKRGLSCGGKTYTQSKRATTTKNIPANAFASSSSPTGWKCRNTYIKSGNSCRKVHIPKNAYGSSSSPAGWKCNSGYTSVGNSCVKKQKIPNNAKPWLGFGSQGWRCNPGYFQQDYGCLRIPKNATKDSSSFTCNYGYTRIKNKCIKIPSNAYASGSGWKCNSGYYSNNNYCSILPSNAIARSYGDGFSCKSGYKKSGQECKKPISIPPNAYASGSGWKCNSGFERRGNSCTEILDNNIYPAGSGSGFATTREGHILTNHHVIHGCSEVTLFKNGKSYLTTVVTQDPNNDLAILQSNFKPTKVYSLSNEVYLSDDIFAAGFPFGKKISSAITINKGIISALMGPGDDISIFQIDADINSGNSGGPIVDRKGNAVGIAVMKLNREKALEELGSVPEGFNFAVNAMMAIGLFRSQGIDLPSKNNTELSVKERNDLFNQGTFYLSCGMTIAQYEKMVKTNKVMFTRDVFFSNFEGN